MRGNRQGPVDTAEHIIDRMVSNVAHGRFERSLSGLTAAAALLTTVEIYLELASYDVPMGPPIAAPGLMCVVGGMGGLRRCCGARSSRRAG